MEYRHDAHTNATPSLLGLGCMRLPLLKDGSSQIDVSAAQAMVDFAFANGINYFDTAFPYHDRTSEKFIGQALKKYPRDKFYLATKMPLWAIENQEDMEQIFTQQLENCGVDYFDFYLFHAVAKERYEKAEQLGLYDFLARKKEQGFIRRLGFSFHDTPAVLEMVCASHQWDFAQLQLNYLDWGMQQARQQYEILEKHGIPCLVMEPVRGGSLADLGAQANAVLQEAAPDASIASWALRFAASLPNVLVTLSGMSNMEQLQDNVATFSPFVPLSETEKTTLGNALDVYKKVNLVPCTGCRYCMDCPCGVDIPLALKVRNQYAIDKDKPGFLQRIETARPEACMACGACIDLCPQGILIPEKMQDICELL